MGEKLDRGVQRALLQKLFDVYPQVLQYEELQEVAPGSSCDVNLHYLAEHGLLRMQVHPTLEKSFIADICITAKGLDFLQDDGGLSAILGVVTVRLHEDTLMQLLTQRIEGSNLPQPEKQRYIDQLRELPAETTKHLVLKLVDAGLENWHKALPLLQNTLGW